jgi:hypothetical protein
MKRSSELAAACLVAGLAAAWTTPASAVLVGPLDDLTLDATPAVNLTDAYFLYGNFSVSDSTTYYGATATYLGNLTGGVDNSISFAAYEPFTFGTPGSLVGTVIGLYDTGNGLITLGFQDYNAGLLSSTPTSFSNALLTPYSEADLATALLNGDTVTLENFYAAGRVQSISGIPVGGSGGLINFSLSAPGGVFSLSATPEPGTMALLGVGAMALFCIKRSRRAIDYKYWA